MKYVTIVNGKPGSGKTTFENACTKYLDRNDLAYGCIVSSINYVKELYKKLGWNGEKTDKARKDLSILKKMWIENNNGPITHIVKFVLDLDINNDYVVFIDIREETEIEKLVDIFNGLGIKCTTLFIDRPDVHGIEYGNKSDDNVGQNMSLYEHIIHNDGNITKFIKYAEDFIEDFIK